MAAALRSSGTNSSFCEQLPQGHHGPRQALLGIGTEHWQKVSPAQQNGCADDDQEDAKDLGEEKR
jgi:hypothetical protein